jgi:DNA-binding response OmpR family regulator
MGKSRMFHGRERMKGVKVLVIDDETVISKMLSIALSTKGYQVDTAESGEEGMNKLQSNDYHLVITDMLMGKMSGEDVLEKVRELKGDSIPVIAMSGNLWMIDEHLFDAVLTKPYPLEQLFETVQNVLSPIGDFITTP